MHWAGETATTTATDYRGQRVLTAYAPIEIADLHWGIIAEIDEVEAFAPARTYARNLALSTAGIVLALALAAMVLARTFAGPVRRMVGGVRQIAAGETGVTVEARSSDEFGALARSFNDMSSRLEDKNELIEQQQAAYDQVLTTVMPATLARRFRDGENGISDEHANVSVIFADIEGFDELAGSLPSGESVGLLNGLFLAFDAAAERHGVERIRTLRQGYLASCGLVTPRIDHVRRAVDFAAEMQDAVESFNVHQRSRLALRAGIDAGAVSSGLLGTSNVVYDMWGKTVSLAYRVHEVTGRPGVFVTATVYDRLRDGAYRFEDAGRLDAASGTESIWMLQRPGR